jgi:hypothetical protein
MRPVAASHRLDHPTHDISRRKFRQQRGLRHAKERRCRVGAFTFRELKCRDAIRPCAQDAGQPAGQEIRVNSVCCREAQRAAHLSGIQRTEQQVVGPAEERPVVSCQPFHHVQVTAKQQEKHGTSG